MSNVRPHQKILVAYPKVVVIQDPAHRQAMQSLIETEATWFNSLTAEDRGRFLTRFAHGLTIGVRVLCHGNQEPQKHLESVRLLNEALHKVLGYLMQSQIGSQNSSLLVTAVASMLCEEDTAANQQASQAWSYAKNTAVPAGAA